MKIKSLNSKFIIFVICLIIPIGICNIISLGMSRKIENGYANMLNNMLMANEIKQNIDNSLDNFNQYILSGNEKNKEIQRSEIYSAQQKIQVLKNESDNTSQYILRDLENTIGSYKESSGKTISAY